MDHVFYSNLLGLREGVAKCQVIDKNLRFAASFGHS